MNGADSTPALLEAILELGRELPPNALSVLLEELESNSGAPNWANLFRLAATGVTREKLQRLRELVGESRNYSGQTLAFALRIGAAAAAMSTAEQRTEIAWTGPGTEAVPLRRVDQVLYDLVSSAKNEVLLVTYVAYKADRALHVLREATERDVRIRLIIELAQESGGKVSFDGLQRLRTHVPRAEVLYWPLDRRTRNAAGSYGAMHAKCVVTDRRRALVSSANLTDYALEANMELGLIVEGATARRLAEHFDQLALRGDLILAT